MQDILAISIVAIAAGYLARQAWLRFSRKTRRFVRLVPQLQLERFHQIPPAREHLAGRLA